MISTQGQRRKPEGGVRHITFPSYRMSVNGHLIGRVYRELSKEEEEEKLKETTDFIRTKRGI